MESLRPFSQLGNSAKMALAPHIPLPAPLGLFLEFTNRCNFQCKICPESLSNYRNRAGGLHRLTVAQFKKIAGDVLALGKLKVLRYYYMGEPLLHPDAFSMIRYGYEQGIADRTELTTNGSMLSPHKTDELIASGLDYLRISVYATNPSRHAAITGTLITPQRIADNVRAVRERRDAMGAQKPFIYVKMIDPFDPAEVTRLHELYDGIADEVALEQPHNWTQTEGRDLLADAYGLAVTRDPLLAQERAKQVCPSPFYLMAIHSDGEVSPCCVDWERKASLGNAISESLADIWRGQKMKEFRLAHIERRRQQLQACHSCDFLYTFPDNIDEIVSSAVLDKRPPAESVG